MTDERKYVRVYYNDLIRDYPDVWANDALLATWLRMLATADPMWPTPPEVPRSVKARPLAGLREASLVECLPMQRFRMKGMEAERSKRADAARNAAAKRWQSEGNAHGNADVMPKRTQQTKAQPNTGEAHEEDDDGRADLEAFLLITRRAPTPKQRKLLDDILASRDVSGPQWAADLMLRHPDDPIGAVIEADKQWRAMRIQEAQLADRPKPKVRRRRSVPESTRELLEHWAATAKVDDKEPAA